MRAAKLVQHMKANAERMSEEVFHKIRKSERCGVLVSKLSPEEQRHYTIDIYQDLVDWLATQSDATIEHRYSALGRLRAQQGIPFSNLYWAACIAHEHLWQYMEQECLFDEPVEFWGGVTLLRSLTQFFDRILYFALLGYEQAEVCETNISGSLSARG